jgi:phenylalanyl-tRNA synthetase beta chain
MQISLNWIREYTEIDASAAQIAEALTKAGIEVESATPRFPRFDHVITARVLEIFPHPNADKLRICRVDTGNGTLDAVCGAPNVAAGQCVPLALEGAELPNGIKVKKAKIRGVVSTGMICSEKELDIGEDVSGIMVLENDPAPGTPLTQELHLDDHLLEVGLTPNRPDCACALGLAREAAALFGKTLRPPSPRLEEQGPPIENLTSVTIDDPEGCPRYAARLIRGVTLGPSPYRIREKLLSAGIRSINNVVDATNYVMMELGQPLHAFDFDLLQEQRIVVRKAQAGDRFTTLDGVERLLPDGALMICDGRQPVALAGIMGGQNSEIGVGTTNVLLESAYFNPTSIRRTSKRLNLSTEASYRFERGTDPEGVLRALDRTAQLIAELAGGEIALGAVDAYPNVIERKTLPLRLHRLNRFLGTDFSAGEVREHLSAIDLQVEDDGPDRFRVTCPGFRPDLEREVDLLEEVARIYGYDRIVATFPRAGSPASPPDKGRKLRFRAMEVLGSAGFTEALNYSFVSPEWVRKCGYSEDDPKCNGIPILNPLSEDQSVMRTSLLPGLLTNVAGNLAFRNSDLRLFELGRTYLPDSGERPAREAHVICGVLTGRSEPELWCRPSRDVDFSDVKGTVEVLVEKLHVPAGTYEAFDRDPAFVPRECARLMVEGAQVGVLGRVASHVLERFDIQSPVYAFDLNFDLLTAAAQDQPQVRPLPRFPAVVRDMALVLPKGTSAASVMRSIMDHVHGDYAEDVQLFDVYQGERIGEDEVSLAYRIIYRAQDKTLSDESVNRIHEKLIKKVVESTGGRLRV